MLPANLKFNIKCIAGLCMRLKFKRKLYTLEESEYFETCMFMFRDLSKKKNYNKFIN